ncbi:MAG: hypothetical protein ACTJGQ_07635 [Agrococcus casei]|uniref:hypothetical protein n=1 Tax=Agrococcus casei TaxID=343512 RepID=UPI003F90DEEF
MIIVLAAFESRVTRLTAAAIAVLLMLGFGAQAANSLVQEFLRGQAPGLIVEAFAVLIAVVLLVWAGIATRQRQRAPLTPPAQW